MKIKFSRNELSFLKNTFFKEKVESNYILTEEQTINLEKHIADEIRDWALEKQQIIGFDQNYELTKEGRILENIIDKLYN